MSQNATDFRKSAEPIYALRVNRVVPLPAFASGQQHDVTGYRIVPADLLSQTQLAPLRP
jgi:hypothetical protein